MAKIILSFGSFTSSSQRTRLCFKQGRVQALRLRGNIYICMNWKDYKIPNWEKFEIKKSLIVGDLTIAVLKLLPISIREIPIEGVRNLIAIDSNENIKWIAQLPRNFGGYVSFDNIRFNNGVLEAWFGSIYCLINIDNGLIEHEEFTK